MTIIIDIDSAQVQASVMGKFIHEIKQTVHDLKDSPEDHEIEYMEPEHIEYVRWLEYIALEKIYNDLRNLEDLCMQLGQNLSTFDYEAANLDGMYDEGILTLKTPDEDPEEVKDPYEGPDGFINKNGEYIPKE